MTEERVTNGWHKEPESDDPHELVMVQVPGGDAERMATCLVEEYARMGMGEEQIFGLFSQSIYRTHQLFVEWGAEKTRRLIRRVLARTGRMHVSVAVSRQNGG